MPRAARWHRDRLPRPVGGARRLRSVGGRDRQVRRRPLRSPRRPGPRPRGCRHRRRARRGGDLRPQSARPAAARDLPGGPHRRAPEGAAARGDRHRRHARAALRRAAREPDRARVRAARPRRRPPRANGAGRRGLPLRSRGSGQPRRAARTRASSWDSTSMWSTTCARSGPGRRVSSTWIRELLAEGDVETAAKLLGRPASVWGEVVHGAEARPRRWASRRRTCHPSWRVSSPPTASTPGG